MDTARHRTFLSFSWSVGLMVRYRTQLIVSVLNEIKTIGKLTPRTFQRFLNAEKRIQRARVMLDSSQEVPRCSHKNPGSSRIFRVHTKKTNYHFSNLSNRRPQNQSSHSKALDALFPSAPVSIWDESTTKSYEPIE